MMFTHGILINIMVIFASMVFIAAEIHDPLNIFCGSVNCYDVLGIERTSTLKEVKKAYRRLSVTMHPDKNLAQNATVVFQSITKAYEVLAGNESRPLFDYYLDNPRDYFKVSGQHYIRNLPKSDVRLVILVALLLVSWFLRHIQYSKYEKVVKFLTNATANNLPIKMGGTPQTLELYKRATELFQNYAKEAKLGNVGQMKMLKDPMFLKIVDQVVAEVKIEGGYRKPEWNEFLIIWLCYLPLNIVQYAKTYHRRYISKEPIPLEDRIDMARQRIGLGSWEYIPESEREKLIQMEIWKQDVYDQWIADREAEAEKKMRQKMGRKGRRRQQGSEEDEEGEYVE